MFSIDALIEHLRQNLIFMQNFEQFFRLKGLIFGEPRGYKTLGDFLSILIAERNNFSENITWQDLLIIFIDRNYRQICVKILKNQEKLAKIRMNDGIKSLINDFDVQSENCFLPKSLVKNNLEENNFFDIQKFKEKIDNCLNLEKNSQQINSSNQIGLTVM